MSARNENFNTGGTGAALFAEGLAQSSKPKNNQQNLGDDYVPPVGLPGWKQPSFDDDDTVPPNPVLSEGIGAKFIFIKNELSVAKAFYFCFFGAFGSLFPLMAVYFKGVGMDPAQCGFLIGVRPIIEYLATPFWHRMSDRFQAGKVLLLMSIVSWILFTLPIGFLHPPVVSCKHGKNDTRILLIEPRYMEKTKREAIDFSLDFSGGDYNDAQLPHGVEGPASMPHGASARRKRSEDNIVIEQVETTVVLEDKWAPGYIDTRDLGTSPQVIHFDDQMTNYRKKKEWISPSFSNEVFERSGVEKVFFLVLLLVIIGEFFASPATALADSAVITSLGDNQDKYGSQRMFGSMGWGVTMFVMGIVLDYSTIFPSAKCDLSAGERNYNVCFYMFSLMMFVALLVATQIPFRYTLLRKEDDISLNTVKINNVDTRRVPDKTREEKLKDQAKRIKVFAKELQGMPEFAAVFKAFSNIRLMMFMLVAWVMGIGIGLIFTFLFWHLQDYGGHPTLFGIASVINHVSEMGAYFYSFKIINQYGHVKVLIAGLAGNVVRFIYISYITYPWMVLPFEFLQGITHAAVWAACCSFISHNTDEALRPSAQGVLQGIHHGFGRFCGAVFGGMFIKAYGTSVVFRVYGVICGVVLVLFTIFNFYNITEGKFSTELGEDIDPRNVMGGEHLAPHGVPSSGYKPRPRSRRPSEEEEATPFSDVNQQQQNPFLEPNQQPGGAADDGNYYGRRYAQEGYSSSGLGY